MGTNYKVFTVTHPDDVSECHSGSVAYEAAIELVEFGHAPVIQKYEYVSGEYVEITIDDLKADASC